MVEERKTDVLALLIQTTDITNTVFHFH